MDRCAVFSPDRVYRYALYRRWDIGRRTLVVIGLNPSTADETKDDPTIRRCIGFARRERCDALTMLNLFALRSTDPSALLTHPDPIGPENDARIEEYAWLPDEVVVLAAWGANEAATDSRVIAVRKLVPAMNCLGLTKGGHPKHPLYVRADQPFEKLPRFNLATAGKVLDLMGSLKRSLARPANG